MDRITNDVTYCKTGSISLAGKYGVTRYGGVDRITNDVTYCKTGSISLAGKYGVTRYGGVDRITNENGSSCTSRLADVVEEALRNAEVVICEGSFMNTFGLNLTNAMFKAQRYLVVSLYCPPQLIYERLTARSNGRNGKRNFELIWKKQRQAMIAARRWQEIGVRVLQMNTAEVTLDEELEKVLTTISELCGRDITTL